MTTEPQGAEPGSPLAELLRWEAGGGAWQVVSRTPAAITVALLTCDRGEQVGLITTDEPAVRDHIGNRQTDEQLAAG